MNYNILKIPALKDMLRKNKLSVSGNKPDLISRLEEFNGIKSKSVLASSSVQTSVTSSVPSSGRKKITNQQNVNIYVGEEGKVQKIDDAKNIYISSGVSASPFLPSGNNPTMQSSSSFKHPVVIPAKIVKYTGVPLEKSKPSSSSSSSSSPSSSSSSSIGEDEEKVIEKPLPKKLNLSKAFADKLNKVLGSNTTQKELTKSVPLPTSVSLPIPTAPQAPPFDVPKKNDKV
jgi:hypothetical protein